MVSAAPIRLVPQPISQGAYAPFGQLLAPNVGGRSPRIVNLGLAERHDPRMALENLRAVERAPLCMALYVCTPHRASELTLTLLECHPKSTQIFSPIRATRYVVIVALGSTSPDLTTLCAFEVPGDLGISYHPGVWHHPMVALDAESRFLMLAHEADDHEDCITAPLAQTQPVTVSLGAKP